MEDHPQKVLLFELDPVVITPVIGATGKSPFELSSESGLDNFTLDHTVNPLFTVDETIFPFGIYLHELILMDLVKFKLTFRCILHLLAEVLIKELLNEKGLLFKLLIVGVPISESQFWFKVSCAFDSHGSLVPPALQHFHSFLLLYLLVYQETLLTRKILGVLG